MILCFADLFQLICDVKPTSQFGKWVLLGSSLNDVTHLGGGKICQKVTLLHKPI